MMIGVSIGAIGGFAIRGQQVKTPPGYVIAEAEVTNPEALQKYGEKIAETLAPFNHRYVVSTSKIEALEGDPPKSRVVEFAHLKLAHFRSSKLAHSVQARM